MARANIFFKNYQIIDAVAFAGFAMFFFYTALPILITQLTCAFFFVSLQRQLWNAQPSDSPVHSTSTMKKFKFR